VSRKSKLAGKRRGISLDLLVGGFGADLIEGGKIGINNDALAVEQEDAPLHSADPGKGDGAVWFST
jgi:hypothetical protein